MKHATPPALLKSVGVDSITLIGGRTRQVLLASASKRLIAGEDCTFEGANPDGVWHVHIVFAAEATPRSWVEYAKEFVVILPRPLAVAKCEEDGAMAVLFNIA